jgi:hypothetical protein
MGLCPLMELAAHLPPLPLQPPARSPLVGLRGCCITTDDLCLYIILQLDTMN